MTPNFRTQLQAILTAHDEAAAALEAVSVTAHDVSRPLRDILDAWDHVHVVNTRAIQAMRTANRAALELLAHLDVQ